MSGMREEKSSSSSSAGIGFTGLLQLVFITLKLCGVIDWPWKYVLIPLWIDIAVVVVLLIIVVVLAIRKVNKEEHEYQS